MEYRDTGAPAYYEDRAFQSHATSDGVSLFNFIFLMAARLEDEYELKECRRILQRKLDLVVETVRAPTNILDADRSTRLETTIILLIVFEILITFFQTFFPNFTLANMPGLA